MYLILKQRRIGLNILSYPINSNGQGRRHSFTETRTLHIPRCIRIALQHVKQICLQRQIIAGLAIQNTRIKTDMHLHDIGFSCGPSLMCSNSLAQLTLYVDSIFCADYCAQHLPTAFQPHPIVQGFAHGWEESGRAWNRATSSPLEQ